VIPDVGWGRVPDGESVRVGESVRCPMPYLADALFGRCPIWPMPYLADALRGPMPNSNFLLLVNAIEQPKSPENPDKVGNSGVSIGQYHKYV
jgi:hypothetical protein